MGYFWKNLWIFKVDFLFVRILDANINFNINIMALKRNPPLWKTINKFFDGTYKFLANAIKSDF